MYPLVGSCGSTGLSGFPSLSTGVNPGTYGNVSVGLPGFVGSVGSFGYLIGLVGCPGMFGIHEPIGLYVTTSVVSFESAVTFVAGTVALSAKYPLTTGDLTSGKTKDMN